MADVNGTIHDDGGAVINVRHPTFGARGDGTTNDTAAIQAALTAAASTGGTVLFPPGVYIIHELVAAPGVRLSGYGATLRRENGRVPTAAQNSRRMLSCDYYAGAPDSAWLTIEGLAFDGNRANQSAFESYQLEQTHCLFFDATATQPGRVRVRLTDVAVLNSPGDGVSCRRQVELHATGLRAVNCFRGGITIHGAGGVYQIQDFASENDRLGGGLHVEVDAPAYGGGMGITLQIDGARLGAGEFSLGLGGGSIVQARNVVSQRRGWFIYAPASRVSISDSVLRSGGLGTSRVVHPGDVTFNDVAFVVSEVDESAEAVRGLAAAEVQWNTDVTGYTGQRVRFRDCDFSVDATVESADTVAGIRMTADTKTNDNRLIVEGGTISSAFDIGVEMIQGGTMHISGARIEAAQGIYLGTNAPFPYNVEIDNVVFTGAVAEHVGASHPDAVLTHRNVELDEEQALHTSTYGMDVTYRGSRTIWVASSPVSRIAGMRGDIARLRNPVASSAFEWVCTSTGPAGYAVWKQSGALAA